MNSEELGLDHFLFHDMATQQADDVIGVQTQFDERPEKIRLRAAFLFANPVQKNDEKILDENAHLTFYAAYDAVPDPTRVVEYTDQFGDRKVVIGRKYGFLSPTQKARRGSAFPAKLDHYVVFQVLDGEPVNVATKLVDQWGSYETKVYYPMFFAAPAKKWHGREINEINNERAHLAIYRISPSSSENTAKSRDQFGSRVVHSRRTVLLAVPCLKNRWEAYD